MIEELKIRLSDVNPGWLWGAGGAFVVLVGLALVSLLQAARLHRRRTDRRYLVFVLVGIAALVGALAAVLLLYLQMTATVIAEA